jgi:hypothetical protein
MDSNSLVSPDRCGYGRDVLLLPVRNKDLQNIRSLVHFGNFDLSIRFVADGSVEVNLVFMMNIISMAPLKATSD